MSEVEVANSECAVDPQAGEKKRETAQVTMSAIGDVGVAASRVMEIAEAPKRTAFRPIVVFLLAVYAMSAGVGWLAVETSPWVHVLLVPLFPTLCAGLAFWRSQSWKF